ncbi:hypothetical protein EV05_1378 [Prochlorococcus sp. MIT 0601]|nr:hypothetical protein EV05_1378 [Prochlorococcus sp. MIT 0601]
MNNDHKDTLKSFASFYGDLSNPINVKMISITPKLMKLEVDGENLDIYFDHTLIDSKDAHKTLVDMANSLSSSN